MRLNTLKFHIFNPVGREKNNRRKIAGKKYRGDMHVE